jgi:1,5-anhydro-D-fructose reductase (1,5-anhydro-D-mannitol-forming)
MYVEHRRIIQSRFIVVKKPSLVLLCRLTEDSTVDMQRKIRLGIIGLGAMGGEMLDIARRHPRFDVALAADPSVAAIERARAGHPDVTYTTAPQELFDAGRLDAVYIASPPATHAAYAVAAMKAGLAVFAEKPLAVDLADGEEMVRVAAATGAPNAMNFALSDRAAALAVQRALRSGEAGAVLGVEMRFAFPQWPRAFQRDAGWLAGRAQGGFLREVASHFLFLTDRLLGPLAPVHTRRDPGPGAERAAWGLFLAGDVPVTLQGYVAPAPETYEWTIHATERSFRITDWADLWTGDGAGWTRVRLDGPRGSEETRLSEFARAVHGEPTTLADFAAGLRVQRLIEHFHHEPR